MVCLIPESRLFLMAFFMALKLKERKFEMGKNFKKIMGRLHLIFLISGAFFLIGGTAAHVKSEEISNKEYLETLESYPFPPGKNAKLAKKVCSSCHVADFVIYRVYDEKMAREYYDSMLGNPDTEQGKMIIEYLVTVLGEKKPNSP